MVKIAIVAILAIMITTASTPSADSSLANNQLMEKNILGPTPRLEFQEVPSFINQAANYIHYPEQLTTFWQKLKALQAGQRDRLHILHIGDSHLQAGVLPGELRALFQKNYGNAGRGLIFPYRLAKTNSPSDYTAKSSNEWIYERNISRDHKIPVGLCGYSLCTYSPNFELAVQLKNTNELFDKITLFNPSSSGAFDVSLKTEAATSGPIARRLPFKKGDCFLLQNLQNEVIIQGKKTTNQQQQYTLQGLLLENTRKRGIVYSSIGVNGATFMAYNRSSDFMEQLASLEPDLIIISLGTNEAANSKMNTTWVKKQLHTFLEGLHKQHIDDALLLVTPPDIYIRSRYKTQNGKYLAEMMHDVAKEHQNIAIWDFYEVMGGYGSINKWLAAKLANKDRVHYTHEGYQLQGQLLFKAFLKQIN